MPKEEGEEIGEDIEAGSGYASSSGGGSSRASSVQSREDGFVSSEDEGRDLNPLLVLEIVTDDIYMVFEQLASICEQTTGEPKDKLHFFDVKFGRTGIYRLGSYFDVKECEAKQLLECRRKPAYSVLCYDEITQNLYSELDQISLDRELDKIKGIIHNDRDGQKLIEFIDSIIGANKIQTKEYGFWKHQEEARDHVPTKIQQERQISGILGQGLTTGTFFESILKATNPSADTDEQRLKHFLCIFQDAHNEEAITGVLLKLMADTNFSSFKQLERILYVECVNNNYQSVLDQMFAGIQEKQEKEETNFLQEVERLYGILKTTLGNGSEGDPVWQIKSQLMIDCMVKGIRVVAIDIATDTTRHFDKTYANNELDVEEQPKETRIKIGDQGMVYFMQQIKQDRGMFAIALVGGKHAKGIKENLCTDNMLVINIHVALTDRDDEQQIWNIGMGESAVPPLIREQYPSTDIIVDVIRQYKYSEKLSPSLLLLKSDAEAEEVKYVEEEPELISPESPRRRPSN